MRSPSSAISRYSLKHSLRRFSGALIISALALAASSAMAEPPKTIEPG